MKIALVHDYLNQWGGGERVLQTLAEMFPEAPIYTLLHDPIATGGRFSNRVAGTSLLDVGVVRRHHRWFIPLMPIATELLKVGEYDLVISDSSGFAKGIPIPKGTRHISYCHSPMRYAWGGSYLADELKSVKPFSWLTPRMLAAAAAPFAAYLRAWDKQAAQKPSIMLANSQFIAGQIQRFYNRDAQVLYPPVDTAFWNYDKNVKRGDYFLAVGRLIGYKKFDLIIDAFNALKLPLKIVGTGREEASLRKRATSPLIEFCGSVSDEELRALYREAQALIFPHVEDFGLVAAEAIACGTPVVAYAAGGALEIVEDGKSGVFFNEQAPVALTDAITHITGTKWNHKAIAASAQKFSKEKFLEGMLAVVKSMK